MDCIRDAFPARHLFLLVDPWRSSVATSGGRDRRRLGYCQPSLGGALAIIFEHEVARDPAWPLGAEPAHSWHNDAMLGRDRPDLHRRKQFLVSRCNHQTLPRMSSNTGDRDVRQALFVTVC